MTVYLVIKASGEYEDYSERIIGAYLNREKAEELVSQRKNQEETIYSQYEKCCKCPAYWSNDLSALNYCEHVASCQMCVDEDGDEQVDCFEYVPYYVPISYWVRELEVIE